ncbi:electron transfer flavoprotein subunit alpha/FixB family protein [Methyloceanibacter sp.]|uniref:electron transfer flavoprotein subunit alpha/FixB family protein n=1 Tax=Methyloceanibacter sp. TaxID=1965321 RepID=UPI003D6D9E25
MTDTAKILIFAEGADTLAELLTAGRALGGAAGGRVTAVAIGPNAAALAQDCLTRGADEAMVMQTADAAPPGAEEFALALREAVQVKDPDTILIGATRMGNDVVARLAQALEVPCASNCMTLRRVQDGDLEIERRVFGGRFTATQLLSGRPQVASVPPSRFPKAEPVQEVRGSIRELAVTLPPPRVRIQATSPRVRSAVDVTKAEVIVAAGRGVKKVEDLALLDALAGALGGVLAGSRPLTGDVDWLPTDRRVGLSGQTVKPNLYIACGISGQIEHIVGMKGARTVVTINNDPKAPIHAETDYSVIGDLYEVVPAFLQALERAKRA